MIKADFWSRVASATASLFGIACSRTHCTAVGQQVDTSTRATFAGTPFTILAGR